MRALRCHGLGWLFAAPLALLLLAGPAEAVPIDKLQQELNDLELQVKSLGIRVKAQGASAAQAAEHRLVDAQVLYTLKDYTRAAILLLDYVNKYKNTRGYPDALFYLADALYHKRDFLSAKRYFRQIVTEVKGKYYQEALQRLVELSLRTGDTTHINEYLKALSAIPTHLLKPSVPYVRAKYYFFQKQTDTALQSFSAIPPGHKYYFHSQYFLGACYVRKKDYATAAKIFEKLINSYPKEKDQKHIRDLAYMAMGRILYEKGKIDKAISMYQKVGRNSAEFDTAMYEIAWAYVKAVKFRKALRALELLVLANPDSPFIPEVKVLQGNLLIRLKKWGMATDVFSKTRDRFEPVYSRMKKVMGQHSDPGLFFDLLLARNEGQFRIKIQVPALAINWVKEKAEVKRALNLVKDVRDIQASIKEATSLIKQLEQRLNTPAKIKIFPEFASSKAKALEVDNRLVLARMRILENERKLVMPQASGDQRSQLHNLAAQRSSLEQQLRELPTKAQGYKKRQRAQEGKLKLMEKELNRLSVVVESLQAQFIAAKKYFEDTAGKREDKVLQSFRKEAAQVKTMIDGLQSELDELSQQVAVARSAAGVGGPEEVAERDVKAKYREIVAKEHTLLSSLKGGLSGPKAAEFAALDALMVRCNRVDEELVQFDKKLEANLEQKLSGIRTTLKEEKQKVVRYKTELADYRKRTNNVAGHLTYAGFQEMAQRFYTIVVRADVGIIDVAWALKDNKSKEVSRLVRQRKMDIKMLNDEFKEVLRED